MIFKFLGYGVHPTTYGNYSDKDLFGMFRGEIWSSMGENERQQLLQETVNRAARSMGEKGACEVRFADLPSGVQGRQSGNVIELNRDNFVRDIRSHEFNGTRIEEPFSHSNYMALETVLHENIHAWQNQVIDKTISSSNQQLAAEYTANNFTSSLVNDQTADNKPVQSQGSHYLNGETPGYGYYMYYLQSTERDAHKYGEMQAMNIANQNLQNFGPDPTAEQYKKEVEINGYQATLSEAQGVFGNPNIEQDINNTLMNHYYGTNNPVDPKTAELVDHEMVESYKQQHVNEQDNKNLATDENDKKENTEENPSEEDHSERQQMTDDAIETERNDAIETEQGEGRNQVTEESESVDQIETEADKTADPEEGREEESAAEENAEGEGEEAETSDLPAEEGPEEESTSEENAEGEGEEAEASDLLAEEGPEEEAASEENADEEAEEAEASDLLAEEGPEEEAAAEENAEGEGEEAEASDLLAEEGPEEEVAAEENAEGEGEEAEASDLLAEEGPEEEAASEENAEGEGEEAEASDLVDGESTYDSGSESDEEAEDERQSYGY